MGAKVVRVVIAGGHTLLRSTLCTLLAHEDDLTVVGQPSDSDTAVELVRRSRPDVVLLDLERADPEAVRTVARLRAAGPRTRVIVMTRRTDTAFLTALARAGAHQYVLRATTYGALIGAVRGDVHDGTPAPGLLDVLTPREAEIMGFVAQALSNRQISRRLAITEDTVKRHLHNAFKKLDVGSRLQAVNRLYGGMTRAVTGEAPGRGGRGQHVYTPGYVPRARHPLNAPAGTGHSSAGR